VVGYELNLDSGGTEFIAIVGSTKKDTVKPAGTALRLPDFRSGSITATSGTCGKPTCHCHQPNHARHGPNYRLTRKVKGKTVTETFATPAELQKAQREVQAYHRFRQLAQELLEINEKICLARPVEQLAGAKKNGGNHPAGSCSRSRAFVTACFSRRGYGWSSGFGSGGDGGSFQHAPGRSGGAAAIDEVRSSSLRTAASTLLLWPYS
jgi:hypothetical protein